MCNSKGLAFWDWSLFLVVNEKMKRDGRNEVETIINQLIIGSYRYYALLLFQEQRGVKSCSKKIALKDLKGRIGFYFGSCCLYLPQILLMRG